MAQLPLMHRAANWEVAACGVGRSRISFSSHQPKTLLLPKSAPTGLLEGGSRTAPKLPSARTTTLCSAVPLQSSDLQPKVWYFAIANAQSLMLDGAALETVLQDGMERALRGGRERDVWLIMEPAFLSEHPGLNSLNNELKKPTAAILSLNSEWMLSSVKQNLPQAVIGKFVAPSVSVPDPLKSNLNPAGQVVGGGGVWH